MAEETGKNKKKILLVDDERDILDAMQATTATRPWSWPWSTNPT